MWKVILKDPKIPVLCGGNIKDVLDYISTINQEVAAEIRMYILINWTSLKPSPQPLLDTKTYRVYYLSA